MNEHPAPAPGPRPADQADLTGDAGVDRVLRDLAAGLSVEDPDAQVEAVTEAHRRLQARLSGPAR